MSRSRNSTNRYNYTWKKLLKKYGNERARARERMYLERLKNETKDPDKDAQPLPKEAADPWDWD